MLRKVFLSLKIIQTQFGNLFSPSVGDPDKMAQQIIGRVNQGEGPLRMALGSDAYDQIRTALLDRLAALEAQKELAYSTDSDDVVKPL
ncbi:hypothetical protein J1TS1_37980 [Shouchella clausii]|uniref:Uncharacterized protein n=1 Tax=Shouchella rhizosphaerae TaxID=866786 RepID=A0ABZ2CXI8_9BACI|nr:hypothetical protein [Shouchella clausii]MCM3313997.1 hypothetical protein [Psychrobacillus sp. MER TA 17]GIN09653.1 hypothetical protein J1TS1_37980 [Shouchella clausii]